VNEFLDDLAIDELEEVPARLDDGHRYIKGRVDGRILDADNAGADDRQAARDARLTGHIVAVVDVVGLERDRLRVERCRSDGDDDLVGFEGAFLAASVFDHDLMRIEETGETGTGHDTVAGELMLQDLDLVVERLLQPGPEVLAVDVLLDPI